MCKIQKRTNFGIILFAEPGELHSFLPNAQSSTSSAMDPQCEANEGGGDNITLSDRGVFLIITTNISVNIRWRDWPVTYDPHWQGANPCVRMMFHVDWTTLSQLSLMHSGVVFLEYSLRLRVEKNPFPLLEKPGHSVYSGCQLTSLFGHIMLLNPDLINCSHPRSGIPPKVCIVGTRYDAPSLLPSCAFLLRQMKSDVPVNLDSLDHMTFFHCSGVQSLSKLKSIFSD